ncbi:MAG: leucine-rich repeat protein, partial [Eubacteriales bacterium]|nr:leucine-rich repeat protein [Eubacteriales bacterium]
MKNRNRGLRRAAAFVLAAVLAGSSVEIPTAAADGDTDTGNTGSRTAVITAFSDLGDGIRTQTLDAGAEEGDITLPETLTVTLETQPAESGVEAAAAVQDPDTQTEPETEEPVPDNMQTEENTGTQENPDMTQEQTEEPGTDQGTEENTEPVTPPATENTEQPETPVEEEPVTQQTEAPVTEAPVQQQEEPAEPSGQEGQSAGTEAPAAETGAAETAAVLQAEPPAEPEAPVTEGQKAPEMEQTVTDTSSDGGILTSLLDAVFPSMTVHAAESTNVQTVENFTLTGVKWKLDAEKSGTSEFPSDETAAGKTYIYVPVLPKTVTVNDVTYTLKLGESVTLPEITVTVAEKTDGYGTIIHEGTAGDCTWTLYDTDKDGTEDLLVIGGTGATPNYYLSEATPWYDYRENIKKVVVEEGVTALGQFVFGDCVNLEEATLPSTLEKIGTGTFNRCTSLDTLAIPSGVTEIGAEAFSNCSSLESVILPSSLESIGRYAFFKCGLVKIEIPGGVETIGRGAFCRCASLQSVVLPDTLTSIEEETFCYDSNLTIIVPESVQTIGTWAFDYVKAVYNLSDCDVTGSSISKKVNCDKITLVENGESSEQRVLPADCVVGSRYAGTRYDASYYYSSGDGNTAWYVKNGDTYEKVTSGTSFQNTPTFYYAKAFNDTTMVAEAAGESGNSYTLVVKDKETRETLTEGMHYTQEATGSPDWEETDTGSLAKTITVTMTGVAGGGYVGTMQTTFQISAEAEASVTADGSTKKYPAFEDAWEAAQGKTAVVTLLADVEVSETLTVTSGSNITLKSEKDSNYTISGNV